MTGDAAGIRPADVDKVDLQVGKVLRVNFTMEVAGIAVSETVRANTPIVDVKQNAVHATVTADLIALLPNSNRDFQSVLTGIAGHELRDGHLRVARHGHHDRRRVAVREPLRHRRPGHDQPAHGLSGKGLVVDFIEQIQVKQSGYNAEFRATTGGVVSVITKSGTNAFHGDGGDRLQRQGS